MHAGFHTVHPLTVGDMGRQSAVADDMPPGFEGRAIRVEVVTHTDGQTDYRVGFRVYRDELAFGEDIQVLAEMIRIEAAIIFARVDLVDNTSHFFHLFSIFCRTGDDGDPVVTRGFFIALHEV